MSGDVVPVTLFDLQEQDAARANLRRLPQLCALGIAILWRSSRSDVVVSGALQAIGAFSVVAQLLVGRQALQVLLDTTRVHGRLTTVLPWALAVTAVYVLSSSANAVQRQRQEVLGELVGRFVDGQILEVVAAVDLAAFETPAFHNRLQRARMNRNRPLSMVAGLFSLLESGLGVAGVVVALAVVEPLLIPILLLVIAPAWVVASGRGNAFYRFYWRMTPADRERDYLSGLLTSREAAKEVLAFGLHEHLRRRWARLYEERIVGLRRVSNRQLLYSIAADAVIGAVLLGVLLTLAALTLGGRITLAEAAVAVAAVVLAGSRLAGAGYAVGALSEASLYMEDYVAFRAMLPELVAGRPTGPAPTSQRRIVLEGVSFSYPGAARPAVRDVDLHIDSGEVVALVGENGSGKTTLAKILAGLYAPHSGRVLWDGVDAATVDPDQLRRRLAVIFQDFLRYHLPARENIGLGRAEAVDDLEAIRRAARFAGVDDLLAGLASGYDTMLGPEFFAGTDLSVGQWQRVALARAFFRDAPFIILDEPTAALDPRAEHDLFERIRELLAERTVLLISHRFSSVRSADRIYVLSGGAVVENGSHGELMALGGRYAELFTLQAGAYLDDSTA